MGWTDPLDLTDGDTITATILNRDIRDNLRFLYAPPGARATHDTDQSVARTPGSSAFTLLDFARTLEDNYGMHGAADPFDREPATAGMEVVYPGSYVLCSCVAFGTRQGGNRGVSFSKRTAATAWTLQGALTKIANPEDATNEVRHEVTHSALAAAVAAGQVFGVSAYVSETDETSVQVEAYGGYAPMFSIHWVDGSS